MGRERARRPCQLGAGNVSASVGSNVHDDVAPQAFPPRRPGVPATSSSAIGELHVERGRRRRRPASCQSDHQWTIDCWWIVTTMLLGSTSNGVRLRFQSLVDQRRRIDRDDGPHLPRRMGEGLFGTHAPQLGTAKIRGRAPTRSGLITARLQALPTKRGGSAPFSVGADAR